MSTFVLAMREETFKYLRDTVESVLGRRLSVRSDFDLLVSKLEENCYGRVSSTTLRRFWGYQNDQSGRISLSSLDILARYCGYTSFDAFVTNYEDNEGEDKDQSYFSHSRQILLDTIAPGQHIRLIWNPGRSVVVRYEGGDTFTIIENFKSKLEVGMTFECATFVQGEPLIFTNIRLDGKSYGNYICGRTDGVTFRILR